MHAILDDSYIFPAAPAQERLWFLQQYDQRLGNSYNIAIAFKINGAVNRVALQKALNYIVARHESLRTALIRIDSAIKQVIKPHLLTNINFFNYSQKIDNDKIISVISNIETESQAPFDLSKPGLIRLSLYQLETECHYLSITMHHSIADGISLEIFIQEMIKCYNSYSKQEQPKLEDLKYQYVDIIDAESHWKSSADYQAQQDYWFKKLSRAHQEIKLSGSSESTLERTYRGSVQQYNLDKLCVNQVNFLAKKLNVTNYTILMSAFCLLIYYYSNEDDFLVGVPVANRYNEEMFKVVGFLANTLLLRVKITGNTTISSFINSIQNSINEYVNFQRFPYNDIVDYLHPKRTVNSNSVFQLMFGYQKTNLNLSFDSGLTLERLPVDLGLSKFDLSFFIFEENDNISLITEYSLELFDEKWMLEFFQSYTVILSSLVDKLELTVSETNFLPNLQNKSKQNNSDIHADDAVTANDLHFTHAASPTEKILENIWKILLQIDDPISVEDNFFNLGGNSLMVTELIELFQKETGISLPIKTIFLSPTIKALAKNVDNMIQEKYSLTGSNELNPALYDELYPVLMELNQ